MPGPLRKDEQQKIIQLKESGCSIAEIKEKTGRSREAICRILKYTGLYPEGVNELIWNTAQAEYYSYATKKAREENRKLGWKDTRLSEQDVDIRKDWYMKVRDNVIKKCKAYRDVLMADIEKPVITDAPKNIIELKESTVKQLNYISEACGNIQLDNLVEFIILKEFLEIKKKKKKGDRQ